MPMVVASILRLVTSPKVFRMPAPVADAVAFIDALQATPCVQMAQLGLEWPRLRQLRLAKNLRGNDMPGAWLSSAAAQAGEHLVTFDRTSGACSRGASTPCLSPSRRIARLMRLGRPFPILPASLMFELDEITAAYVLTKKPPPAAPPSLHDMVRQVAMLGGFLARQGDGEPGLKTIWIVLQRVKVTVGLGTRNTCAPGAAAQSEAVASLSSSTLKVPYDHPARSPRSSSAQPLAGG